MSDVIEELKDRIQETIAWRSSGWRVWKEDLMLALDKFAEAHPGLYDYTEPCEQCGVPIDAYASQHWGTRVICGDCQRKNSGGPR